MNTKQVGFIGLGTMGMHMAAHLHKDNVDVPCIVYNRSAEKALAHQSEYGTISSSDLDEVASKCDIVFLSLPSSNEVEEIVNKLSTSMKAGSIVIDTTSGDPGHTKKICATLKAKGIEMVDAPVSGGPSGAQSGQLTSMCGGNKEILGDTVMPLLERTYSGKKVVNCGPIGSGMAVKAINNILNTAHNLIGAEGLLALRNFGVEPNVALEVINASSGRSLATEERLPQEALTNKFNYGFALKLMAKDCRIADSLMKANFPKATLIPEVNKLINEAEATEWGPTADYSACVKVLEERSGNTLS